MLLVQKIAAPNDRNGNPQRGWWIYKAEEDSGADGAQGTASWLPTPSLTPIGFVCEGYRGRRVLHAELARRYAEEYGTAEGEPERRPSEMAAWLPEIVTTPGFYRATVRDARNLGLLLQDD